MTATKKTDAPIVTLIEAKLAARKGFTELKKTGFNPHFKSNYSTLGDIMDACSEALTANGIDVSHIMSVTDGVTLCTCRLTHNDGEAMESSLPGATGTPQQMGSAITYNRRYTLQALLGLEGDPQAEDDGNQAQAAKLTGDQIHTISALIREVDADPVRFCEYFDVENVYDISPLKYDAAIAALKIKGGK